MKLRPAVLMLALAASSFAWGEALDPPERVARRMHITQPALAQIEASMQPRKATRARLAKALGIAIEQLPIR